MKQNRPEIIEQNKKQIAFLVEQIKQQPNLKQYPVIKDSECPDHKGYFAEKFLNEEKTIFKQTKLVGDGDIYPDMGSNVEVMIEVNYITQMQFQMKMFKNKSNKRGWKTKNASQKFTLRHKIIKDVDDD